MDEDQRLLASFKRVFKNKKNREPEILCSRLGVSLEKLYHILQIYNKRLDIEFANKVQIPSSQAQNILAVADSHLGSDQENLNYLIRAFTYGYQNGSNIVLFVGDLTQGIYPFMSDAEKERGIIERPDLMANYAVDTIPFKEGVTIYAVSGNHDLSYFLNGYDVLDMISKQRDDIIYLGPNSADVLIGKCKIHLCHSTYIGSNLSTRSYFNRHFDISERPNIFLTAHHHYAELSKIGNTYVQLLPALATAQTKQMAGCTLINIIFFQEN